MALTDRTSVEDESIDQHIATAIDMASFIALRRTGHPTTEDTDILQPVDVESTREIGSTSEVVGGVGLQADVLVGIVTRSVIDELTSLPLGISPCLLQRHGWLAGEEQEIVGDRAVELHADVLRLEEEELHGGVVLHVGDDSAVVGPYARLLEFPVLADHSHQNVAREVEERIRDLTDLVFIEGYRGVAFGHIGVDPCPLLGTTWLDEYIIIVLDRCSIGGSISGDPMQFGSFLHTRHSECLRLGVARNLALLLGFLLQVEHFLDVGHLQFLHTHIVFVGIVVNTAYLATPHGTRFGPVAVEACAVGPPLERHIVAQVVACRVFQSLHQPVVERSPQVVALFPSHGASLAQGAQSQLGMGLVATCLLTLSCLTDVLGQRTIVVGMEEIIDRSLVDDRILKIDATRHAHAVDDGSPVAVGIRGVGIELVDGGQKSTSHHVVPLSGLVILQQGHGPDQMKALDEA